MQFQNIGFGQQIIIFFSASFFFKYDSAKINMRFGQKNFVFTTLLEKTGKQKNKIWDSAKKIKYLTALMEKAGKLKQWN